MSNAIRWRLVAVGILVVGGFVLIMAGRVSEKIEGRTAVRQAQARPLLQQINTVIDTLLFRHGINRKWVRSWGVFTPTKRFIREERRIYVPPRFISVDFNHDLSRELGPHNVRVVATERTREMTVSMHIVFDRMVVETLVFVLKRDLE